MKAFYLCLFLMLPQCVFFKALVGIQPRKPEVELLKLQVKRADLKGVDVVAQLAIKNPNDFQLRFSDVKYQLSFHDKVVAEGVYQEELLIKELTTTTLDVPIHLNTMEAAQSLFQFFQDRKGLAKWTADANFISPLGKIAIHLSDEKELH